MTEVNEFNRRNIEEFRSNHGRLGGPFEGAPVLLLHTNGARSGQERVHGNLSRSVHRLDQVSRSLAPEDGVGSFVEVVE